MENNTREKVLTLLERVGIALPPAVIADEIGTHVQNVWDALQVLVAEGKVEKRAYGRYAIPGGKEPY